MTRHCKSCDVCHKTTQKGSVPKVTLESMLLIEVAIYQQEGRRYILTLVDYVTPYQGTVPLKNIDTETIAEGLVDVFSHLGVPEEVLSDLVTQFVSNCMKEVMRLLSIKKLTTAHITQSVML